MIEIPQELLDEWKKEYEEGKGRGLRDATDEEIQAVMDEVMAEMDEEIEAWAEEVMKEPMSPEDEAMWDELENADTPLERVKIILKYHPERRSDYGLEEGQPVEEAMYILH